MTFNYFLSHCIIPQSFFKNLDFFYESIIVNPQNLQIFLKNVYETATAWTQKYPDAEPAFHIDKFNIGILGESPETGIAVIVIPNCQELNDCGLVAIPCMLEHPRYFTCEFSCNPLNEEERFFIIGEWKQEEDGLRHINYGPIDSEKTGESFVKKISKLVFDVDYTP